MVSKEDATVVTAVSVMGFIFHTLHCLTNLQSWCDSLKVLLNTSMCARPLNVPMVKFVLYSVGLSFFLKNICAKAGGGIH